MPIFGAVNKVDEKKLAMDVAWREKCKNVSGVDIDVKSQLRLYEDLLNCRNNVIDTIQLRREINYFLMNFTSGYNSNVTISDLQAHDMAKAFRKFVENLI